MSQPIDGKSLAEGIRARVRERIAHSGITPGFAAVLVGDDPASHLYVRLKEAACAEVGIRFERHHLPETTAPLAIMTLVRALGARSDIHGILVQLPLPAAFDANPIITEIPPEKDVDGFHPANVARLLRGDPRVTPPLGRAILALIDATTQPIAGSTVALLANSETFCQPIEAMLRNRGATVHRFAPFQPGIHSPADIARADICITALGCGEAIDATYVHPGATLIDIGIDQDEHGRLHGDFARDARDRAAWYTPVPGGVGPVTVAMLLENVIEAAERQR